MPFTFKPDIAEGADPTGQAAPQASLGASVASSATNLMERAKSGGKSILEVLLIAALGFTAFVTVALFAYKFYLSSQIDAKKATLAGYETRLAGIPLEDMRKTSNRLKLISQLIKEHPSVNVAFLIVEASVENMITFHKFDLGYSEASKSYKLNLGGSAPDYKSVAQQMDTFKRKPYSTYVSKVTIESLSPDATGKIAFSLAMPISITGLLPETFSIMDGETGKTAPAAAPAAVPGPGGTTTSVMGAVSASTTVQATKP